MIQNLKRKWETDEGIPKANQAEEQPVTPLFVSITASPSTIARREPDSPRPKRIRSVVSPLAARRVITYVESNGGYEMLARKAKITVKTVRSFEKTGKIRRSILDDIAAVMGTTSEDLIKPHGTRSTGCARATLYLSRTSKRASGTYRNHPTALSS
jgi:hypothetical protein